MVFYRPAARRTCAARAASHETNPRVSHAVPQSDLAATSDAGGWRDRTVIAAVFLALVVLYWGAVYVTTGGLGFPLDDAYIHLQFARHLWEDGQMAFNRGVPSSGCTAPLYPVLLAGIYAAVRNWHLASAVLGAACGLMTAWVVQSTLYRWTGQRQLARAGGLLTVLMNPLVVSAGSGMETPAYVLVFVLGLRLYAGARGRLAASALLALGIALRPEFLVLLPCILLERALAARADPGRRWLNFTRDAWRHLVLWSIAVALYAAYHWHQDRHWLPTTFGAKAIGLSGLLIPVVKGLPAAAVVGGWLPILLALTLWPALTLLLAGIGLGINCAPLAFGLREAAASAWRNPGPYAPARRLAVLVLLIYPLARGFVDPAMPFWYQFQRYYAHLSPLLILIALGTFPVTGALVQRRFWNWTATPTALQLRRAMLWALPALVGRLGLAVLAVGNIDAMQVHLGHWVHAHTRADELVATNDIGAIGFFSRRPILDTVGLIEPGVVEHQLRGGHLLDYLAQRRPAYVIVFPNWYPDLVPRADVLKPVHSVRLKLNVICGGPEMVVYRPRWADADATAH